MTRALALSCVFGSTALFLAHSVPSVASAQSPGSLTWLKTFIGSKPAMPGGCQIGRMEYTPAGRQGPIAITEKFSFEILGPKGSRPRACARCSCPASCWAICATSPSWCWCWARSVRFTPRGGR